MVAAIGLGVTSLAVGDTVAATRFRGGYREANCAPATDFVRVPEATAEALALASSGVAAWLALTLTGQLQRGETVVISAQIESDLIDLSPDEAQQFLSELGVKESGVGALIRATYHLLGLRTYFTAGEKEARAWTIHAGDTAPQAAGVIHTDFEKGFIKAEVVSYEDLSRLGSVAAARDAGKYRLEGKEYVFQDGDVALFRFNN